MPPDEKNRIEDLKQSLYSRNAPDIKSRRKFRFSTESPEVPQSWDDPADPAHESNLIHPPEGRKRMSFTSKFLITSVVFCMLAIGVGAYIFFNGANFISGNNIEIEISGPISVPGGAPVSFTIVVTNKNSVALKTADLSIHFPAGTTDPQDTTQSLESVKEVIGDLEPGASITKNVNAVIFGEENLQKKITASVTYGIAGSNSVFTKEASYDVIVNASPINVTVTSLEQTNSGQQFDLNVSVKSNSENTVKNVIMRATYPFGYSYRSSSPQAVNGGNNVWSIGDIPPGAERKIVIHGILTGEDSDLKVFHFTVGARSPTNPTLIGTTFMETEQILTMAKPFVSLGVSIDSDSGTGDHVGIIGRALNVNVRWANNLPETLSNVVITAHLSGSAYDKNNVTAYGGYFRSLTDDVIWDQKTNPELAFVSAGANGSLSFSVTPSESQSANTHLINPEITITGVAAGDRTSSANVPLNTGVVARKIKVLTNVGLSGRVVRGAGVLPSSGPIPPVAEQKTTYTVAWTVDNTSNAVRNAVVTATLPPYVTWTGQFSPVGEDITFDKNNGQITWNAGNIDVFSSGTGARKEIQFQVSLEPSVDQVGTAPIIVNQATLVGLDTWTKTNIQASAGYLTSNFSSDPGFKVGDDIVARKR